MPDIVLSPTDSDQEILKKAVQVLPSERQFVWQELEFIGFLHFGVNTFTNKEWGEGTEDPNIFCPTDFDADQIVSTILEAGMKAVILTCKHHDGFCLWPSKYTEHSVKNSVWKDGKGDVVREISDACRKYGIKFGIYLSPWDRHDERYGNTPAYNEYYLNQLTELLTEYGEIFDLWLDGACAEGPNGRKQEYDWRAIFEKVRTLQPQATITGVAPDARWCGNEAGVSRMSEWSVIPIPGTDAEPPEKSTKTAAGMTQHNFTFSQNEDLGSLSKLREHAADGDRLYWYPAQVDVSIRPGWFYHDFEDDAVRPLDQLIDMYLYAVGGNSQLLLNLPPDKRGQIAPPDVERLREIGSFLKETFSVNLIQNTDKLSETEYILYPDRAAGNLLMLAEDITKSQRVESFEVYEKTDAGWESLCKGTTIGYKRFVKLQKRIYSDIKVVITAFRAEPAIKAFGLYLRPSLSKQAAIKRDESGYLHMEADRAVIYYTLDGTTPTALSTRYDDADKPLFLMGGTVSALAVYESGAGQESISTVEFGICPRDFTICNYSKEKSDSIGLSNIFTNDSGSYAKIEGISSLPYIDIDLNEEYDLKGIHYMPIDTGYDANLNITAFTLSASIDGENYQPVLDRYELSNIYHNPVLYKCSFTKSVRARYVRFQIEGSLDNKRIALGEMRFIRV